MKHPITIAIFSKQQEIIDGVDSILKSLNIDVHYFDSLKKIEDVSLYQAFLIDDFLPKKDLQEIVSQLRNRGKDLTFQIGFLNRKNRSFETWKNLKEMGIDLVVDFPIDTVTLQEFLETLSLPKKSHPHDDFLEEFVKEYAHSIPDKLFEYERLIENLKKELSREAALALQKYAHKLAGSSGSYGYMCASRVSKELELEMVEHVKSQTVDASLIQKLDTYFSRLKLAFQIIEPIGLQNQTPEEKKQEAMSKMGYFLGDEESLFQLFKKASKKNQIDLQKILSFEELKSKITKSKPQYVVLSHEVPRIEEILSELHNLKIKTFYIAEDEIQAHLWKHLKKDFGIDFILDRHLSEEFIEELFKRMHKSVEISEEDYLEELKKTYIEMIPDKILELEKLIQALSSGESSQNLKDSLHKISGSAGSYGYQKVGELCRSMISLLSEKEKPDKKILENLWEYFRQLKIAFQLRDIQAFEAPIRESGKEITTVDLFVIDDDDDLLKQFQARAVALHIGIEIEIDPRKALNKLKELQPPPKCILIDKSFPDEMKMNGFDLLKSLRELPRLRTHTIFGMLTSSNAIEDHIKAASLGVEHFFEKPLDVSQTLLEVKDFISERIRGHFRVLLLDDDIDFCNFVESELKAVDIQIETIQDETLLYEKIGEVLPNLLLLDLSLPNYSGVSLLQSLRGDQHYHLLPVMVISGQHQEEEVKACYELGIEDFIEKPIEGTFLQLRVQNFIRKRRIIAESKNLDPISKLYNREAFLSLCRSRLSVVEQNTLVFLKILPTNENHLTNEIVRKASEFVSKSLGQSDIIGTWDFEHIAILLTEILPKQAETLLKHFYDSLQSEKEPLDFSFHGALFQYLEQQESLETLIAHAIEEIEGYPKKTLWQLKVLLPSKVLEEEGEAREYNLIIVDDDVEILKMLTYSFEMHKCKVKTFERGMPAMEYFREHLFHNPPDLVILDFVLPDISGIEILQQIREIVGHRIPIMMMSTYSKEQDIQKGLEAGADAYIPKPFTLSTLVERAFGYMKS